MHVLTNESINIIIYLNRVGFYRTFKIWFWEFGLRASEFLMHKKFNYIFQNRTLSIDWDANFIMY